MTFIGFLEQADTGNLASGRWMWPIQFLHHGSDTATSVIVVLDETCCSALNSLKMV